MTTSEDNGNIGYMKPSLSSTEDLSEYTDADESISAPTEFLAEFLSAVMLKDYLTALKYCKLILQYEPNNATAKEFYPLITGKLQLLNAEETNASENDSDDDDSEQSTANSTSESESSSNDESSDAPEEDYDEQQKLNMANNKKSKSSNDGNTTTGSYSSLEDDEAETDQLISNLAAKYNNDNVNLQNGNQIYETSPTSDLEGQLSNANISYSTPVQNHLPFGISSDSESPTEPVTQHTIALLRAKVIPN